MSKTELGPSQSVASDQILEITRIFDAPRQLVFEAWTHPQHMMQWWGPRGFTCPVCRIDLRPGGIAHSCMRSPEGLDYWSKGVYQEVVEPERLVCTDCFSDEEGNIVDPEHYGMNPDWPREALITVNFAEEKGGKTKVTLQHSPIPPGNDRDMCRQGWNESLDKLAEYLAATAENG